MALASCVSRAHPLDVNSLECGYWRGGRRWDPLPLDDRSKTRYERRSVSGDEGCRSTINRSTVETAIKFTLPATLCFKRWISIKRCMYTMMRPAGMTYPSQLRNHVRYASLCAFQGPCIRFQLTSPFASSGSVSNRAFGRARLPCIHTWPSHLRAKKDYGCSC